jgi:hypothetical protein
MFAFVPPELAQAMDQQRMEMVASAHDTERFFDEASKETLQVVRRLLSASTEDAASSGYYLGRIGAELKRRFGLCPACGSDHDNPFASGEEVEAEDDGTVQPALFNLDGSATEEAKPQRAVDPDLAEAEIIETFMQYRLKPDSADSEPLTLDTPGTCTGCGISYISLRDRMLRQPDDCSGCHQKSAHG